MASGSAMFPDSRFGNGCMAKLDTAQLDIAHFWDHPSLLCEQLSSLDMWIKHCLTDIYSRNFSGGTGLRALAACLRIPDWPRRLVSNFAHITAGLGGPKMQLAHLIGSHQWEMPSCTGFSGFAWDLITSRLRRAAISTCLGPVVSATCAILMH